MTPPSWVPLSIGDEAACLYRNFLPTHPERAQLICRLICDPRMREVFEAHDVFDEIRTLWRFIESALMSSWDYSVIRDNLKRAGELSKDIEKAAEKLARLLKGFYGLEVVGPREFQDVGQLLRSMGGADLRIFREPQEGADLDSLSFGSPKWWAIYHPELPKVSALVESIATAAGTYVPTEFGMLGAAIARRQNNQKNEYLRAFWHILQSRAFSRSLKLDHLMATAANVVLNDPDADVSSIDVTNALND